MRRRRLKPDEAELWAKVVASASPLRDAPQPRPLPMPSPLAEVPQRLVLPPLLRPPAGGGSVSIDLGLSTAERLAAKRTAMDRKTFGRMKRGKMAPDARLDLHGMTQARAHEALTGFILLSHQIGRRLVLVITGKGAGPAMGGVLRQQVPHWLSLPPLRPLVLQLAEAHLSHGGAGAIYVYLRRQKQA